MTFVVVQYLHMTLIFDGRGFAKEKELQLQEKVLQLKKKNITPKLVSIVVGDVDGAMKYQEMKKKVGERVGVEVGIREVTSYSVTELLSLIQELNKDPKVHGIMIQLPLPKHFSKEDRDTLIEAIALEKDVDGMNERSPFIAPVVMAVLQAFNYGCDARSEFGNEDEGGEVKPQSHVSLHASPLISHPLRVAVVGSEGFEGRKIVKAFQAWGYKVMKLDTKLMSSDLVSHEIGHADVVVSATGIPNSITGDMIKEGAIVIDVGAPKGDFELESIIDKASFITPVPGGIGPVTIVSLMENVVEAASS